MPWQHSSARSTATDCLPRPILDKEYNVKNLKHTYEEISIELILLGEDDILSTSGPGPFDGEDDEIED